MEENKRLIEDNMAIENKLETMNLENKKLRAENKNLLSYFELSDYDPSKENKLSETNQLFNFNLNVKLLFLKIEELEDIIAQYKNTNSPVRIVEIEESFLDLNLRISEKEAHIERLNRKLNEYLKKNNLLFDESEAINSISKALSEKDIAIVNLRNQLKEVNFSNTKSPEVEKSYEKNNEECKE
jgi:hypothetical protein